MRLFRPLLVVLCLTLCAPIEVSAPEGRVALVIGNTSYVYDGLWIRHLYVGVVV